MTNEQTRRSPPSARDLLAEIEHARADLVDAARPDAVARQHARGKLTARQRIEGLLDTDSFVEVGAFGSASESGGAEARRQSPSDGVVVGTGRIDSRHVVVLAQDFTVVGGSIGKQGTAKTVRAVQMAISRGQPLVLMLDGGGHRIQDGQDSRHFAHASSTLHSLSRASGWVPIVALMLGAGFAGPTNFAGLSDFAVMVRGLSAMGIAGPALVKAGVGEDIDTQSLGGADIQVDRQGLADLAVDTEEEAFAAARRFLSYLPTNCRQDLPMVPSDDPPDRRSDALVDLVPAAMRQAYDVRKVIALIADTGSVFEIKPTFAGNIVTACARLDGRPVGFVANQPLRLGGMIDANASEKAARFVGLCDAFGLPLISLVDVPGFAIGSAAERTTLGRRSAKLLHEWAHTSVPRICVILRKGYGAGFIAMCGGRSFSADACYAWPTAQICAMSIEGSVDVAYRKDYLAAPDPAARREELIEGIRSRIGALRAAEGFGIDDVIDPRDTRRLIIDVLAQTPARRISDLPPKFRPVSPI